MGTGPLRRLGRRSGRFLGAALRAAALRAPLCGGRRLGRGRLSDRGDGHRCGRGRWRGWIDRGRRRRSRGWRGHRGWRARSRRRGRAARVMRRAMAPRLPGGWGDRRELAGPPVVRRFQDRRVLQEQVGVTAVLADPRPEREFAPGTERERARAESSPRLDLVCPDELLRTAVAARGGHECASRARRMALRLKACRASLPGWTGGMAAAPNAF
jgi:hypothetical protein